MRIVVASDTFKESLSAPEVCQAIASGVRDAVPEADVVLCPMADGGEGTVRALVTATRGRTIATDVRGPLGDVVTAAWGMLGGASGDARRADDVSEERAAPATAVIEMAAASGLPLVPPDQRNPLRTSTYGTGELVSAALDEGARRIILGIGGSATNDGGTGCAQALGVRFLDASGRALPAGLSGGSLGSVHVIDVTNRDRRLADCEIQVACDVDNPLCGPRGASAVYGPQKGATPEMVRQLDDGLARLADIIQRDLGRDVRDMPGAGAAGGLGAGLVAFMDATLRPGIEIVIEAIGLDRRMAAADLVITGEGRLDAQSMMGKVVHGVGTVARQSNVPVIAVCGSIGPGAATSLELIRAYFSIVNRPMTLDEAMANAADLLRETAANVLRVFSRRR